MPAPIDIYQALSKQGTVSVPPIAATGAELQGSVAIPLIPDADGESMDDRWLARSLTMQQSRWEMPAPLPLEMSSRTTGNLMLGSVDDYHIQLVPRIHRDEDFEFTVWMQPSDIGAVEVKRNGLVLTGSSSTPSSPPGNGVFGCGPAIGVAVRPAGYENWIVALLGRLVVEVSASSHSVPGAVYPVVMEIAGDGRTVRCATALSTSSTGLVKVRRTVSGLEVLAQCGTGSAILSLPGNRSEIEVRLIQPILLFKPSWDCSVSLLPSRVAYVETIGSSGVSSYEVVSDVYHIHNLAVTVTGNVSGNYFYRVSENWFPPDTPSGMLAWSPVTGAVSGYYIQLRAVVPEGVSDTDDGHDWFRPNLFRHFILTRSSIGGGAGYGDEQQLKVGLITNTSRDFLFQTDRTGGPGSFLINGNAIISTKNSLDDFWHVPLPDTPCDVINSIAWPNRWEAVGTFPSQGIGRWVFEDENDGLQTTYRCYPSDFAVQMYVVYDRNQYPSGTGRLVPVPSGGMSWVVRGVMLYVQDTSGRVFGSIAGHCSIAYMQSGRCVYASYPVCGKCVPSGYTWLYAPTTASTNPPYVVVGLNRASNNLSGSVSFWGAENYSFPLVSGISGTLKVGVRRIRVAWNVGSLEV